MGPHLAAPGEFGLNLDLGWFGNDDPGIQEEALIQWRWPCESGNQTRRDIPRSRFWRPAAFLGERHHRSGTVTIQHGADDSPIEESHAVVVLGLGGELCNNRVTLNETANP